MKKVITYGTFDLFHEGHNNLLRRAKELGDYLIVGVTTEHFDEERGKINVVDSIMDRIENVKKSGFADEIIVEDHEGQKLEDIQKYGIDVFTVGSDWVGTFDYLNQYCKVTYLDRTPNISSTILRKEKSPIVRLGIIGSGRIVPRFLSEMKFVSGVFPRAIYNPHEESAVKFGKQHEISAYYGEIEEFLEEVDAVYIASPNETHFDYCKVALEKNVHVLCEKPLVFKRKEAEELFQIAEDRQLILMEGIKTAYCPGFAQLLNIVKSGKIGEVKDVEACFSRLVEPGTRESVDSLYGGAFLEYGSYTLLPILKLLGLEYKKIEIDSIYADNGIDEYTKIHLIYEEGFALSKTGVAVKSEGQLVIAGTKGYVLAESPWWLTRKFEVRYENASEIEHYNPRFLGDGLRYEISEFISKINGRNERKYKLSKEESIFLADIVERFMDKRNTHFKNMLVGNKESTIKIWAHRGCSYLYPENTIGAFLAAAKINKIEGVELDIQLSKDRQIVVFHDESLARLMENATGYLKDYNLEELKQLKYKGVIPQLDQKVNIPSLEEVFVALIPYCQKNGLKINIELKNSVFSYEGMEEQLLELINKYQIRDHIVCSSFYVDSLVKLKKLDPLLAVAVLHREQKEGLFIQNEHHLDGVHPAVTGITGNVEHQNGQPIRVWNSLEPFYAEDRRMPIFDLLKLEKKGITDFITNRPEMYLT